MTNEILASTGRAEPADRVGCRPAGDRIDRSRPWPSRSTAGSDGFAGDTLASALLANGIDRVGASIYDRRPRGTMTAGMEEPNALVQVDGAAAPRADGPRHPGRAGRRPRRREPGRPGPASAAGAAIRAGSTASTRTATCWWSVPGRRAGCGRRGRRSRRAGDPRRRADRPRGRRAIAARAGDAAAVRADRARASTTTARVAVERRADRPHRAAGLWHIRARPGRAGHRGARAADRLRRQRPAGDHAGRGGRVPTSAVTASARANGRWCSPPTTAPTPPRATSRRPGSRSGRSSTHGRRRRLVVDTVRPTATAGRRRSDGSPVGGWRTRRRDASGRRRRISCSVSGGWNPAVAPVQPGRRTLRYDEGLAAFVPDRAFGHVEAVGAAPAQAAGIGDLRPLCGRAAAAGRRPAAADDDWATSISSTSSATSPSADLRRARRRRPALGRARQALHHHRHGADQGQTSGVLAAAIAADAARRRSRRARRRPRSGRRTAGRVRRARRARPGRAVDPVRTTADPRVARRPRRRVRGRRPVEAAAVLPADGEDMDAAVLRECRGGPRRASRSMDASTLGKIDVAGPRRRRRSWTALYTDRSRTLAVGTLPLRR